MYEPTLFDESAGSALRDEGMALALSPDRLATWKDTFRVTVQYLAHHGARFTSEDVVSIVGLPNGEIAKDANNAVGAMMNGLAKRGVIRKTSERRPSRRPTSHGAELAVWEAA